MISKRRQQPNNIASIKLAVRRPRISFAPDAASGLCKHGSGGGRGLMCEQCKLLLLVKLNSALISGSHRQACVRSDRRQSIAKNTYSTSLQAGTHVLVGRKRALISRVKELIDAGADAKEERAASISGCSTQPVNHFDRFAR